MNDEEKMKFIEIVDNLKALRLKKSEDYGTSWKIFGLDGILYQIRSKFVRIMNLTEPGKNAQNESLRDSFIDLANYSLMAVQLIDSGETQDSFKELLEIK